MQWTSAANAGFTSAPPWLPIADDSQTINTEVEMHEANSILNLYRQLIELRRREPALAIGDFAAVPATGDVLAYRRQFGDTRRYLVVLNFADEPANFHSPTTPQQGTITLSTHLDREKEIVRGAIELRANEGVIVELTYT
jgi:alpha-glucosidase